jgi:hypothetical protein
MPGRDWGSTPTPTSYNRLSNSGSTRGLLGNADDMSRSDSHQSLLTGEDRVCLLSQLHLLKSLLGDIGRRANP